MDLIKPLSVETNVLRVGFALDDEPNTLTSTVATVLTLVELERLEVDHLTIEYDTEIVLVRTVPAVDLVEVKLKHQLLGILGNIEGLEGSLALVLGAVPPEELGETRVLIETSTVPSGSLAVLKVFEPDLSRRGARVVAVEPGRQLDIVEPGTLVVHSFIQTRLELNLHLPITLVVAVGDVHRHMMDLIKPLSVETDVLWVGFALDNEPNTLMSTVAVILTPVHLERIEVDSLSIEHDIDRVPLSTIPAIDLVEVKLEDQLCGILGNVESLEGSLVHVAATVPSEKLGKARVLVDASVLPSGRLAVLKVFETELT